MMTLGNASSESLIPVFYYFQRAMFDPDVVHHEQLITLASILPHAVNTHSDRFKHQIVKTVNEKEIRKLDDLRKALQSPLDGFHIFEFEAMPLPLILDAETLEAANEEIQQRYGITQPYIIHDMTEDDASDEQSETIEQEQD